MTLPEIRFGAGGGGPRPKVPKAPRPLRRDSGFSRGNTFTARYESNCTSCLAVIHIGDAAFYPPGAETPSGMDCCGEKPDVELLGAAYAAPDVDPDLSVDLASVLPRIVRSPCSRCWIIPASNGVCDCS